MDALANQIQLEIVTPSGVVTQILDASGDGVVIFPNKFQQDNLLPPYRTRPFRLPDQRISKFVHCIKTALMK